MKSGDKVIRVKGENFPRFDIYVGRAYVIQGIRPSVRFDRDYDILINQTWLNPANFSKKPLFTKKVVRQRLV